MSAGLRMSLNIAFIVGLLLMASGLAVLAMRWNGSVWSDDCRDMGGTVARENRPSGALEGDLYSCVINGTPVDWERF